MACLEILELVHCTASVSPVLVGASLPKLRILKLNSVANGLILVTKSLTGLQELAIQSCPLISIQVTNFHECNVLTVPRPHGYFRMPTFHRVPEASTTVPSWCQLTCNDECVSFSTWMFFLRFMSHRMINCRSFVGHSQRNVFCYLCMSYCSCAQKLKCSVHRP